MKYDKNNIFAKILRGEIPCKKVFEDEHTFSFEDINPQADVHILVIPKGEYTDWSDFSTRASSIEIEAFCKAIAHVAFIREISHSGYRVISNIGNNGNQEVPHLHMHVLGGRQLGPILRVQD